MKPFTIHKPTHKWFGINGTSAICIGQVRGDTVYLNRLECGKVVERSKAIGVTAEYLTGYGTGVDKVFPFCGQVRLDARANMRFAYWHVFGDDVEMPDWCERHDPRLTYDVKGDE